MSGDFSGLSSPKNSLADRIQPRGGLQRSNPRPRNHQSNREENKIESELLDFSGAFTNGSGIQPPKKPALGSRRPNIGNKPKPSTKPSAAPKVKMTKAMELRAKMNKDKRDERKPAHSNQQPLRERSMGKD